VVGDVCEKANDRLISAVSKLTSLERDKLQSLRWESSIDEVVKMLEKETGKPFTDKQRKNLVTLLEENKAAVKKAYAEDAE
jgi:benzoyl-CoA reductase/2-hydroxyglutaryl-CoA dehydratase subunit BcrC/BadD/HgdB